VPLVPDDDRIYVYAGGIVAGTLAQLLFLLPYLRGKGPFPLSLGLVNPYVRRVLVLMLPVTLGLGLININALVDLGFASLVSEAAPRAIDAAFRLYILPQGIFSVAISTVLFPTISRLVARGDVAGLRRAVGAGLRQIFFMLAPASALLLVLAEPIVRLVYQHGEFDAASTDATAEALFYFTLGLCFNGASLLLIRAFFSLQRPWLPTKVALLGVVLNAALDAALYGPLGVGGIPLSTSITSFVTFVALVWLLGREIGGLDLDDILDGVIRSLLAAALLALLAWSAWRVVDDALGRSLGAQILSVGAGVAAGTAAYLAAAQAMAMPELRALARLARPLR
jgi:putative peptidoglycan lipid II flippase